MLASGLRSAHSSIGLGKTRSKLGRGLNLPAPVAQGGENLSPWWAGHGPEMATQAAGLRSAEKVRIVAQ